MAEIVKVLNDLELHGALVLADNLSEFPANPRLGTFCIKDRMLYCFIRVGSLDTWYPFSNKSHAYIHTQGIPALTWVVNHSLGTDYTWFQVQDESGNIMAVKRTAIDNNSFELNFTSAAKGTVVVVAADTIDVPVVKSSLLDFGNVQLDSTGIKVDGTYVLSSWDIPTQVESLVTQHLNSDTYNQLKLENAEISTKSVAFATTAEQILDAAPIATFRTLKYLIQATLGNSFESIEITLIHNNIDVYMLESNLVSTSSVLATYDADIAVGNVRLLVTPTSPNVNFKLIRTAIIV